MQVYRYYVASQIRDIIEAYHPDRERLSQEEKEYLEALEKCYNILSSAKTKLNHVAIFFFGIISTVFSLTMDPCTFVF